MTEDKFNKAINRLLVVRGVKPSSEVIKAARSRLVGLEIGTLYKTAKDHKIHQSSLKRLIDRILKEDQANA